MHTTCRKGVLNRILRIMSDTPTKYKSNATMTHVSELLSPRKIADLMEVRPRTVKKWEEKFGWEPLWFSHKMKRYRRAEVEKSLGISFEGIFEDE